MADLIERLRAATMGFDWSDLSGNAMIPAVPLLHEAIAALSQEREARERAERDRGAAIARARTAEADAELWQIQAEGKQAAEASLAEAKRLLKPFARIADCEPVTPDGASTIVNISRCRDAARFLSQEPNHER